MPLVLSSDTAYVADDNGDLFLTNFRTYTTSFVAHFPINLFDIALTPDGRLLATSGTTLYALDVDSGTATSLLNLPNGNFNSLVYDKSGVFYSYSQAGQLISIDPTGRSYQTILTGGPSSDGDLLSIGGQLFGTASGNLIRFTGTGISTVASLGNDVTYGLTADENGVLLGFEGDRVYDIDTTTGRISTRYTITNSDFGAANGATSANDFNLGITLGTPGNDLLSGDANANVIYGAPGNDTIFGLAGADLINGNAGADLIFGNLGADLLYGGQGNDTLYGGQGDDVVLGNIGDDVLLGNIGADFIYGGQGSDTLFGGQGNDVLSGDLGNDVLSGDLGADRYVFGQNSGRDLILGFSQTDGDRLDLQGQTYTVGTSSAGNAVLTLSGGGTVELQGISRATFGTGAGYLA